MDEPRLRAYKDEDPVMNLSDKIRILSIITRESVLGCGRVDVIGHV